MAFNEYIQSLLLQHQNVSEANSSISLEAISLFYFSQVPSEVFAILVALFFQTPKR